MLALRARVDRHQFHPRGVYATTFLTTQPDRAERLFHQALAVQKQGLAVAPRNQSLQLGKAMTKASLGRLLWSRQRLPQGEALMVVALATFERIGGKSASNEDGQWFYARSRLYYGIALVTSNRRTAAEVEVRTALAAMKRLRDDYARNPRYSDASITAWYPAAGI